MSRRRGMVAGAAAIGALVLASMVTAFSLPIDDFWLSLASAREIREGAPIDRALDLGWMATRSDAINPQWASQLILGFPGFTGGALAVNAALIGGGLLLLAVRTRHAASATATAVALVVGIGVLAPHLLARNQSFSILLLPLALLLIERRPVPAWLPVAYAVLVAAWANLHGAFVIAQVVAVIAAADATVQRSPGSARAGLLLWLTAFASVAAPLANPAGADLLAYAYAQPGLEVVRSISVEWQPSWPWIPVATLFWAMLALLVLGRLLRRWGASPYELLLGLALAALAASSIRHIPWFVIATLPLLARDVDALLRAQPVLWRAAGEVPAAFDGRRAIRLGLLVMMLAVAFQPLRPALPPAVSRITPDAPVQIADALDARLAIGSTERILNEQVWGGYLAYRLGDRIEIAMDGRLEIRDRQTWVAYFDLLRGDGDPARALASQDVRWAALRHDRADLIRALGGADWSVLLDAPEGVLMAAPGAEQ